MRFDRSTTAEADRLNDLWDRCLDRPVQAADRWEAESLSIISRVQGFMPPTSPEREARVQARIERMMLGKDIQMTRTSSVQAPLANDTSIRRSFVNRVGIPPNLRAVDRFATFALILALVSALVVAGAFRDELGGRIPSRFAAIGESEMDDKRPLAPGSQLEMSIDVRPGEYDGGHVGVGLWIVTLPADTAMTTPQPSASDAFLDIGFSVTTGSVVFGSDGTEQPVAQGGSVGGQPNLEYVRNDQPKPAQLLVLAPLQANAWFPLSIGPSPSDGVGEGTPPDIAPVTSPTPILVSSVEIDDSGAHQYRVMVTEATLVPDVPIDVSMFGPRDATLSSITVQEGQLTLWEAGEEDSPPPRSIQPGETIALDADGAWAADLSVPGPDGTRVLGLSIMAAADNPTLNQNLESVAPFWGEWTVPASGEIHFEVRRLLLQPGGSYSLPTDAGVVYHVASGQVVVFDDVTGIAAPVDAGGTIAQNPGVVLTFRNGGPEPVELLQTVVSAVNFDDLYQAFAEEILDRVSVEWLVRETESLPPGDVTLMLEVHGYNGENDGGSAGEGSPGVVLITSTTGEIEVSRTGGTVEVVPAPGEAPIEAPLGEGIRIEPGGYLAAEAGAGWSVTGGTGAPSTGIVFSVSPNLEPGATPVAAPMPHNAETASLVGDPVDCDIEPLTSDKVDAIVATPSASTDPLERSLRDVDGGTIDPATTNEILALLQAYTDCNATGDYSRIYAFYSDQAVRESEPIQNLVEAEHTVGELPRITSAVEDIVGIPDGRAGARTVIDGQPAYLTFVYEGGRWVIDVWDDSGSGLLPGGTPPGLLGSPDCLDGWHETGQKDRSTAPTASRRRSPPGSRRVQAVRSSPYARPG